MNPRQIVDVLQEPELIEAVSQHWLESQAARPPGPIAFLDPAEFRVSREWSGFDAAMDPLLETTARRIAASPELSALAWHCYWRIYDDPDRSFKGWPHLNKVLGDSGGVFYVLLTLALVPRLRAAHRARGFPEDVTRETTSRRALDCEIYRRVHSGQYGFFTQSLHWLKHYLDEPYVRLGRFEYWGRPFNGGVVVFRHRQTGAVRALAEDGARLNAEGFMDGKAETPAAADYWTATLERTGTQVRGYPILPVGRARRAAVTLPADEWEEVLAKGTPVLDIHIPFGGNMRVETCGDSLRRAVDFFTRYVPQLKPAAFVCASWVFSPLLETILPPTANLVRFEQEIYLYPIPSRTREGPWFLFFQSPFNLATAPRETSIQRAILEYLESGRDWRSGGMFLLVDDLPRYGTQVYRK